MRKDVVKCPDLEAGQVWKGCTCSITILRVENTFVWIRYRHKESSVLKHRLVSAIVRGDFVLEVK